MRRSYEPIYSSMDEHSSLRVEDVGLPVRMISFEIVPQQLFFSCLICPISPDLISIFFSLKQWGQMYPRPHLLPCELPVTPSLDLVGVGGS